MKEQTHLRQPFYIKCKEDHYFEDNKCQKSIQNCIKSDQQSQKCLKCDDGYYNNNECKLCNQFCSVCQMNKGSIKCLQCLDGYENYEGSCQKCGNNCQICKFYSEINKFFIIILGEWLDFQMLEMCIVILKSSYSLHDQKYYISLDGQNWVENKIPFCLYAFAYAPCYGINSLDYEFFFHSNHLKNQISICEQCQEKYTYNQEENKCQPQQYNNECYYSYLAKETTLQEVCLFGPKLNTPEDPVSFVTQSLCLNNNCHICIADQINIKPSYLCLECNNGYYAEKLSGFCLPCPPKLNCQICYQQNKISKNNWKNQLRAFYRATLDDNQQSHSFIIDI